MLVENLDWSLRDLGSDPSSTPSSRVVSHKLLHLSVPLLVPSRVELVTEPEVGENCADSGHLCLWPAAGQPARGGRLPSPLRRGCIKLNPQTALRRKPPHLASGGSGLLPPAPPLRAHGGLSSLENHPFHGVRRLLCPRPRRASVTWLD